MRPEALITSAYFMLLLKSRLPAAFCGEQKNVNTAVNTL